MLRCLRLFKSLLFCFKEGVFFLFLSSLSLCSLLKYLLLGSSGFGSSSISPTHSSFGPRRLGSIGGGWFALSTCCFLDFAIYSRCSCIFCSLNILRILLIQTVKLLNLDFWI